MIDPRPVLAGLALTTLAGCTCTDVGCVSGLSLELLASRSLDAGDYELHSDGVDGFTSTCAFTVGEDAATCGELAAPCVVDACQELSWVADDDGVANLWVVVPTSDPQLDVALVHDGTELWRGTVEPEYSESAPNGERCGPICTSATEALVVELPGA